MPKASKFERAVLCAFIITITAVLFVHVVDMYLMLIALLRSGQWKLDV